MCKMLSLTFHPGSGSGQSVFVIDTGIRHSHNDYGGRASYHWDYQSVSQILLESCLPLPFRTPHTTANTTYKRWQEKRTMCFVVFLIQSNQTDDFLVGYRRKGVTVHPHYCCMNVFRKRVKVLKNWYMFCNKSSLLFSVLNRHVNSAPPPRFLSIWRSPRDLNNIFRRPIYHLLQIRSTWSK